MTGWEQQLDRLEVALAAQRRAVAEGRPQDVEPFVPEVAGPLPARLAERARGLSAQADAVTAALAAATASAARQLQVVTVMTRAHPQASSYVDRRG